LRLEESTGRLMLDVMGQSTVGCRVLVDGKVRAEATGRISATCLVDL
jgi:hypothetical protein